MPDTKWPASSPIILMNHEGYDDVVVVNSKYIGEDYKFIKNETAPNLKPRQICEYHSVTQIFWYTLEISLN